MGGETYRVLNHSIKEKNYDNFRKHIIDEVLGHNDKGLVICSKKALKEIIGNAILKWTNVYETIDNEPMTPEPPRKCQHKYRDYNWYIEYEAQHFQNGNKVLNYRIFEPYVCIICHERYDACLEKGTISLNDKSLNDAVKSITDRYPKITNRAEIEDAINDDIHVDREYLKWADFVSGRASISNRPITLTLEASKNVVEREDGGEEKASEALQGQRSDVLGRACLQG